MNFKTIYLTTLVLSMSFVAISQARIKTDVLKSFIGKDNKSFVDYLQEKKISFTCSEIIEKPFYISGVEYKANKKLIYRIFFENSWAVTAPNQWKRDCSKYEGFSSAKIIRIEILKNWNLVEVVE